MGYIDIDYYRKTYVGESEENDEVLNKYIRRASDLIDQLTNFRIKNGAINLAANSFIDENVKKATAAQVEYYVLNGGDTIGVSDDMSSVSIGGFNYSKANPELTRNQKRVSPTTIAYLQFTGLLYSGIEVFTHG
ncbi:hypothetical protein HPX95_19235 [Bacillus tequilensis]|uniref:hypothetical protein n=1 Tax=Bacillus tequilensis TaxID=227866 RepID=UPI001576B2F3|nr:hypothetical protein [Bacillus tequilensis]NTU28272.1 hypothetical protein [Bacillus tequilensis]